MRRKIVAGNWKMNTNLQSAIQLITEIKEGLLPEFCPDVEVICCPPSTFIHSVSEIAETLGSRLTIGAQNVNANASGAFTGEIACSMIRSVGARYCIIGHSERRALFGESDRDVAEKIAGCIEHAVLPIVCCGESLDDLNSGFHEQIVSDQLKGAFGEINEEQMGSVVIAYEPVWAIGTGQSASPQQAQSMHAFIRKWLAERFSGELSQNMPLLYGGSCKPTNAKELFSQPDIDGGLIGGASLKATDFLQIISAFPN